MIKNLKKVLLGSVMLAVSTGVLAQNDPKAKGLEQITEHYAMSQLRFLASDMMEGRATATKGEKLAGHYIASVYEMIGLKPAGDIMPNGTRSYFQRVPLVKRTLGDDQSLTVQTSNGNNSNEFVFSLGNDYTAAAPQSSVGFNSEVVFVGYGLVDEKNNYNDFDGVDLKGKVVVKLSGFPGHTDRNSSAYKKFASSGNPFRDPRVMAGNAVIARSGAVGVIIINSETQDIMKADAPLYPSEAISSRKSYSIRLQTSLINSAPVNINASRVLGETILGDIDAIEEKIASTQKPQSKNIAGKKVELEMEVKSETVVAYNVLGMIEGKNTDLTSVVAAHYDHMGMNDDGFIWNGADDNASGVAAVMTIAKAFLATGEKPATNVVFGAWTGEENGFIGSTYYVNNFDEGKLKVNVNFDMVSRYITDGSNDVLLQYVVSMPMLLNDAKANTKNYGIDVNITTRELELGAGGSTDYAPFSRAMVPFISWKGGHRAEYHRHTDEVSTIDTEIFIKLVKMGFVSAWDVVNKELVHKK